VNHILLAIKPPLGGFCFNDFNQLNSLGLQSPEDGYNSYLSEILLSCPFQVLTLKNLRLNI
jgi:hypothetical protein